MDSIHWWNSRVMQDHYPEDFSDGGPVHIYLRFRKCDAILLRIRFPEIEVAREREEYE